MKYLMLLSVMLVGCAVPIKKESACYFPGGNYKMVATLENHSCKDTPKESFEGTSGVIEKMPCGVYKTDDAVDKFAIVNTFLIVDSESITGRVIIRYADCSVVYKIKMVKVE